MFAALEGRVKLLESELLTVKERMREDKFMVEEIFTKYFGSDFKKEIQIFRSSGNPSRKNKRQCNLLLHEDPEDSVRKRKRRCGSNQSSNIINPSDSIGLEHSVRIEDNVIVFDYHHGEGLEIPPLENCSDEVIEIIEDLEIMPESPIIGSRASRNVSTSMSFGAAQSSSVEDSSPAEYSEPRGIASNNVSENNNEGSVPEKESQQSTSSSSTNFDIDGGQESVNLQNLEENEGEVSSSTKTTPENTPPDIIAEFMNSEPKSTQEKSLNRPLTQGTQKSSGSSSHKSIVLKRSISIPNIGRKGNKRSKSTSPHLNPVQRWLLSTKKKAGRILSKSQGNVVSNTPTKSKSSSELRLNNNSNKSQETDSPPKNFPDNHSTNTPNSNNSPDEILQPSQSSRQNQEEPQNPQSEKESNQLSIPEALESPEPIPCCSKSIPPKPSILSPLERMEIDPPKPAPDPEAIIIGSVDISKLPVRQRKRLRRLQKLRSETKQRRKIAQAFVDNEGQDRYLTKPKVITIDSTSSSNEDLPPAVHKSSTAQPRAKTSRSIGIGIGSAARGNPNPRATLSAPALHSEGSSPPVDLI